MNVINFNFLYDSLLAYFIFAYLLLANPLDAKFEISSSYAYLLLLQNTHPYYGSTADTALLM